MSILTVTAESLEQIPLLAKAGAQEVLFACRGHSFSALAPLDDWQLARAYAICRRSGVAMGVLMNRLYQQEELAGVDAFLHRLQEYPGGSIYFSDPAVAWLGQAAGLCDRLIYRPDTLAVSRQDTAWWLKRGLRSVSVSPLLTPAETCAIGQSCPACQVTVHGHLLMSMSARPLLSAYQATAGVTVKLRSRRDLQLREENRTEPMPVYETEQGTLIYTGWLLTSFEQMPAYLAAGISRFLINGVFLEEAPVTAAVRSYRAILEGADAVQTAAAYRQAFPQLLYSADGNQIKDGTQR